MFDLDKWQEIWETMRKNKLRTILTAFGVFWGIFMLVLLLGFGKGMENGVMSEFQDNAKNSIWIWGNKTTVAYNGLSLGREIHFNSDDYNILNSELKERDYIARRNQLSGQFTVNYKEKNSGFAVYGANMGFFKVNSEKLVEGRHINEIDVREQRKVAFIGERARKVLFANEDPIGKYISVKGIFFKVIGTYTLKGGGGRREERVYMPYTTYQTVFEPKQRIQDLAIVIKEGEDSKQAEERIRLLLSKTQKFDPNDKQAVGMWNNKDEADRLKGLFLGINIFVWFIGICTLVAGIVGVSNIMLIIVKERTKEIGIRKAIGATPFSIVSQILQESIVITSLAGYLGLLSGILVVDLMKRAIDAMEASGTELPFFRQPEIDLNVALSATIVLVMSGAIAGLIPALKAAKIKPIEALRAD
jgi:putative ABC transport system permease protein